MTEPHVHDTAESSNAREFPTHSEIQARAEKVRLLLMDCDGVLTDARITLIGEADEQKSFHARDGHGLVLLHRAGLRSGIISGRTSTVVVRRAADLQITFLRQGSLNKIEAFEQLLAEADVDPANVCFVGDDVVDIPIMRRSGFAVAVADGSVDTRAAAHYVTSLPGGNGAVREVCELILKAQGKWNELMQRYRS